MGHWIPDSDLDLDSKVKDLDLDLDLRGEDLDLDLWREDLDLDLDSDCEDLTTSLLSSTRPTIIVKRFPAAITAWKRLTLVVLDSKRP